MDHDEFLTIVEQAARAGGDAAERATRATLQTRAERLDRGEARAISPGSCRPSSPRGSPR